MTRVVRRCRAGVVLALLGAALVAVAIPASPAAADKGAALIILRYPSGVLRYGDVVDFGGEMRDVSSSCGVADCDPPRGLVTVRVEGEAQGTVPTDPSVRGYSDFWGQMGGWPDAGSWTAFASFQGDFTVRVPAQSQFRVDPRPCATTLEQNRAASNPSEQVIFTADVSTSLAPAVGSVTFFQDSVATDLVLGTADVDPVLNTARLVVPAGLLPLGATTGVYAVFSSGDGNHESGCRSNDVGHTVVASPPPTAQDDRFSTVRDQAITFDYLANDSTGDGGPFGTIEIVDDVDHGERDGTPTATTYTPEAGFVGDDSFTYFVRDDEGVASAEATVNIIVECTPTAEDDGYTTVVGTALTVDGNTADPQLLANDDTCQEGAELDTGPEHGTLTGFSGLTGSFTYTPDPGFAGVDSFTYRYTTGPVVDSIATVRIAVDSGAPPLTPDEAWVVQVYETFLGRAPDRAGLAYWADRLGTGTGRSVVLRNVVLASESTRGPVVTDLYDRFLDRAPTVDERRDWGDLLLDGTRYHWVERTLLSSAERHTASGGTDDGYVRDLYRRILGRPASDADVAYWVGRLGSGEARLNTVDALLDTPEARGRRVVQIAGSVLDRPPTTAETAELGALFKSSRDPRKVAVAAFLLRDDDEG